MCTSFSHTCTDSIQHELSSPSIAKTRVSNLVWALVKLDVADEHHGFVHGRKVVEAAIRMIPWCLPDLHSGQVNAHIPALWIPVL